MEKDSRILRSKEALRRPPVAFEHVLVACDELSLDSRFLVRLRLVLDLTVRSVEEPSVPSE